MTVQPKYRTTPCPHCGAQMRVINGLYLRNKRTAAGLSQRAFGKLCGLSSPYVSDIETNRRAPESTLIAIYESLHLSA